MEIQQFAITIKMEKFSEKLISLITLSEVVPEVQANLKEGGEVRNEVQIQRAP